jgi:hypothetical protein
MNPNHPDMSPPSSPKTIVCFGDSNTWGFIPGSDCERFPYEKRWPGVMASRLGSDFRVIEEGQNGRMTVWDDPFEPGISKCGLGHLPVVLETHQPIDLVILMLGTNDLKHHMAHAPADIAHAVGVLVDVVLQSDAGPGKKPPGVLVVSPAAVNPGPCPFWHLFEGAAEKSLEFPPYYSEMSEDKGVAFLNAAEFASCPVPDSIHIDEDGLLALGKAMADKVLSLPNL